MKNIKIYVGTAVLCIAVFAVNAYAQPGTPNDPLVSRSYVDNRIAELETQIAQLSALIIGGIVGEVSARLFVPLIQLSYTAADQVLPLLVVMQVRDYVNLYGMLGFMIILVLIILSVYVSRIKIHQALKLGED